jgi:hypothetical protein
MRRGKGAAGRRRCLFPGKRENGGEGVWFMGPSGGRGGGPDDAAVTRGGGAWRGWHAGGRLLRPAGNGWHGSGGATCGSRGGGVQSGEMWPAVVCCWADGLCWPE